MPQDIGGLLLCQITFFSITYKPGKGHHDADTLSHIKWPEAIEINSQAVLAFCEGVHAPHGKIETLSMGPKEWDAMGKDNAPPGMTPLEWCQAQAKDPAINQIVGENKQEHQ